MLPGIGRGQLEESKGLEAHDGAFGQVDQLGEPPTEIRRFRRAVLVLCPGAGRHEE